jgi:excinuclease ABC subunit A
MSTDYILVRGARQHNLKNIDLDIPRNSLVVITGLSGSGKSSLAFDTLYAEGQRRYVESLSTYARQFLERMEKPDVDFIEGLSPAIAIEQKTAGHNPRSTVGTVTEIYDYLRLLFARVGIPHCHRCGKPIVSQSLDQMMDHLMSLETGSRIILLAPLVKERTGSHDKLFKQLMRQGFSKVRVDGNFQDIEQIKGLDKKTHHTIDVVVDRLIIKAGVENRLADSLELTLSQSSGIALIEIVGQPAPLVFSEKAVCITCGVSYPPFTPASFSFNSPQGACPNCDGLGAITAVDPDLVIPNPELSLREGAVLPWAKRDSLQFIEFLEALTHTYGTDIYTPYKELPEAFRQVLLYGSGDTPIRFYIEHGERRLDYSKPFEGIIPKLERRYKATDSSWAKDEIQQYMNFRPCTVCKGSRLNPAALSVRVQEYSLSDLTSLSIGNALEKFQHFKFSNRQQIIADRILKEVIERLGFLQHVGLSYLTLDRSANTLSGGESQRIRLATQIGSKLTGVLYVLDEPSVGLHQRDNQRLLSALKQMRDLGNTVLVVEHDEETIRAADHVVDIGPGAGILGGEVMFSGSPEDLVQNSQSLTGQYLSGRKRIETPSIRRPGNGQWIRIEGACGHNLKEIRVDFPLGCFICVTGVSGSGKSTLVLETLYNALKQRLYHSRISAAPYTRLEGLEFIDKVINIDQSPIGKTPRSNPATYTGVFTHIRDLFARTQDARQRGFKPGRFSFNVKGGRCEACGGDGVIRIEMHFLPDVYVTCDVCNGKRYNRETLEIRYKGKHIADVLDMTVHQALEFFEKIPAIHTKLQTLYDVGLDYIRLGQPATTLSGGEAQRIKLSSELSKKGTGKTLYILDEPTTGLHIADIQNLLHILNRLVDAGNTVLVIEHHLDVIKSADYLIDLGPEGGDDGGNLVGCGTPEALAGNPLSHTGRYLQPYIRNSMNSCKAHS